jgi:hypothetical protein
MVGNPGSNRPIVQQNGLAMPARLNREWGQSSLLILVMSELALSHSCGKIKTETNSRRSVMKISRLNFSHLPTPVEALPRLSEALGGPRLLIKRDDQTGLTGGNKTIDLTLRPRTQSDLCDST